MAPWEPGIRSPNPKGRPKGKDALSEILREHGAEVITTKGGAKERKQILAELIYSAALTGVLKLGARKGINLNADQWLRLVAFLYERSDGRPLTPIVDESAQRASVTIFIPENGRDKRNEADVIDIEESEG